MQRHGSCGKRVVLASSPLGFVASGGCVSVCATHFRILLRCCDLREKNSLHHSRIGLRSVFEFLGTRHFIFMNRTHTGVGTSMLTPVGVSSPVDWLMRKTMTLSPDWFATSMNCPLGSMAKLRGVFTPVA